MRLLLTHGYFLSEDPKEQTVMKPYVPLGLLYLSAHLRQKGFAVEVYDSTFGSKAELLTILQSEQPGMLGVYANLMTRPRVVEILAWAREAGWLVVAGGPEPANYPEQYLDAGAHVVVAGEGEIPLEQLLRSRADPTRWHEIGGLLFRAPDGSVVRTPPSTPISNLDAQPWPDREQIDMERYLSTWRRHHGKASVSVVTARGCPYRCDWCSHSVFGHTHRRRSPHAVLDEIEWVRRRYEPDQLWLADDVFTIHPGWLFQYATEMKQRQLVLPFECITRADRVTPRIAETLAELQCFRVWIGSESGSQRILDAMQRGVTAAQVRNSVRLCKEAGLQTGMFLMWGYPGEEIEDVETTIAHVKECRPDIYFTTVSYPIKGTPYYQKVASRLIHLGPWSTTTDRDCRIRGRHSRRFYQHADELLRSELSHPRDDARVGSARAALHAAQDEVEA